MRDVDGEEFIRWLQRHGSAVTRPPSHRQGVRHFEQTAVDGSQRCMQQELGPDRLLRQGNVDMETSADETHMPQIAGLRSGETPMPEHLFQFRPSQIESLDFEFTKDLDDLAIVIAGIEYEQQVVDAGLIVLIDQPGAPRIHHQGLGLCQRADLLGEECSRIRFNVRELPLKLIVLAMRLLKLLPRMTQLATTVSNHVFLSTQLGFQQLDVARSEAAAQHTCSRNRDKLSQSKAMWSFMRLVVAIHSTSMSMTSNVLESVAR